MRLSGKFARLLGALALAFLAGGCAGLDALEAGAPIRAIALSPYADRPAELIVLTGPGPLDGYNDPVGAALVRFEGQRLALRSGTLRQTSPYRGTIREFLGRAVVPGSFRLYEVRGKGGRTLGYLLAREHAFENVFLDEDEVLVANAMPPRLP